MKSFLLITHLGLWLAIGCQQAACPEAYTIAGPQSQIVKELIDAVNEKNVDKYVRGCARDVQIIVESKIKINGIGSLIENRANHFRLHPHIRSEIQHMVEIDNRVILHDKVWLSESDQEGQDIVEIFTFSKGEIAKIEVIQPRELFGE